MTIQYLNDNSTKGEPQPFGLVDLNDEEIKNIVGKKIFPLVVAHDVEYPFIVFSRTNVNPSYISKDVLFPKVS